MNDETILLFRKELQNLGYSKTVVNNYPKQVKNFLDHQKKHFAEIHTQDILDYHLHLKTIIGTRTKKPFSESYIHSILLAIKLYFEYLQKTGAIKINPYRETTKKRLQTRLKQNQQQLKISSLERGRTAL